MTYPSPETLQNVGMWLLLFGIGALAVYLLWCLVQVSFKMLLYLALLALLVVLLKRYHLLPPEVEEWLEPKKIIEEVQERLQRKEGWLETPSSGEETRPAPIDTGESGR